jgi:hypothetical protein
MDGGGLAAVLQHSDEMIAGSEPEVAEGRHERGNFCIPRPIGEPLIAVDNGERIGVALDAGNEARSEIKHADGPRAAAAPRQAPP